MIIALHGNEKTNYIFSIDFFSNVIQFDFHISLSYLLLCRCKDKHLWKMTMTLFEIFPNYKTKKRGQNKEDSQSKDSIRLLHIHTFPSHSKKSLKVNDFSFKYTFNFIHTFVYYFVVARLMFCVLLTLKFNFCIAFELLQYCVRRIKHFCINVKFIPSSRGIPWGQT